MLVLISVLLLFNVHRLILALISELLFFVHRLHACPQEDRGLRASLLFPQRVSSTPGASGGRRVEVLRASLARVPTALSLRPEGSVQRRAGRGGLSLHQPGLWPRRRPSPRQLLPGEAGVHT